MRIGRWEFKIDMNTCDGGALIIIHHDKSEKP